MGEMRDWSSNRELWLRVLVQQTGQGVAYWNEQVREAAVEDEAGLRAWLRGEGVTGYAATLLVMERFGYPDFVTASADELIDGQYADRPHLRPIYEAIIAAVAEMGEFAVQSRKSYVSLLTPRRTFARVRPSTKSRVDVGLRLEGQEAGGRLLPSNFQKTMRLQVSLTSPDELDEEALRWLQRAYDENA